MRNPRKLVSGVGINNAHYITCSNKLGYKCHFYNRWVHIMHRCYSGKYPNYEGCAVHPDWHYFMNFRAWMMFQDWEGKHLDKDILFPDNKIYGPDTCLLVSNSVNNLLTGMPSIKTGKGISLKYDGCFEVRVSQNNKNIYLGRFSKKEDAIRAYAIGKINVIKDALENIFDDKIKLGLNRHIEKIQNEFNLPKGPDDV